MIDVLYFAMKELGLEPEFPHVFCITKNGDYKILDKGKFYYDYSYANSITSSHPESFWVIENFLNENKPIYPSSKDCLLKTNEIHRVLGFEKEYEMYFAHVKKRPAAQPPTAFYRGTYGSLGSVFSGVVGSPYVNNGYTANSMDDLYEKFATGVRNEMTGNVSSSEYNLGQSSLANFKIQAPSYLE